MMALLQKKMSLRNEMEAKQKKRQMKGQEDLTIEHKFWNTQVELVVIARVLSPGLLAHPFLCVYVQ